MNNYTMRKSSGVAMVELAIILPLLLMLLFGIIELGRALYQQNTLYKAVESGARYLARANGVLSPVTGCDTTLPAWTSSLEPVYAKNLVVYGQITVAAGSTPLLPNLDDSDAVTIAAEQRMLTKTDGVAVPICVITVHAETAFSGFFGDIVIPFTTLETFQILAETEERYIGL
jgi:Flp pilus assembly protein TadG